jgi:hypothetical protein
MLMFDINNRVIYILHKLYKHAHTHTHHGMNIFMFEGMGRKRNLIQFKKVRKKCLREKEKKKVFGYL